MEEPWDFEFLSRIADSCLSFLSEFVDDWLANDMRVSIFKILLSWLIFSLIAIHFAWKVYGNTVNDMYYRQGTGQNGGTPDTAPHTSGW
ncbi:T-cell leukemia translocation-altered gene protein homolog isoform X2 [Archocentrus centrarchus]|nr:T-cell leukemia translocation-altered gene protein isoform X2 [Archocentrus centrarchus]